MMGYVAKWKPDVDKTIMGALKGGNVGLWEVCKDYFLRGGKRLRPALVLLGAKEAGGSEKQAMDIAAAVEIMHTFTLIHDDIEDSSDYRRGKPCLHQLHGVPLAVNAGDALFAKSFQLVAGHEKVARRFAETMCEIAEGQDIDIKWSMKGLPSESDYIGMVEKKTSALIGFSLEAGYIAVSGKENLPLRKYGKMLGVAFQIVDDILGVAGDSRKTGKDTDKDIEEGKKSLPIIKAVEFQGNGILNILKKEKKTQEDIQSVKRAVRESGALDYCKSLAHDYVKKAKYDFKNHEVKETLKSLEKFIVEREF